MPARSRGLPRGLGAGLILLALWLQALAPAGGLLARARAAEAATAEAVIHAVICGRDADGDPGATSATDPPSSPKDCDGCPLCRCTAVAPLPTAPEAAVRPLHWRPAAWPTPPPAGETRPPRSVGLARAPPRPV